MSKHCSYDECTVCGRPNERSRGISQSKFCGYHYNHRPSVEDDYEPKRAYPNGPMKDPKAERMIYDYLMENPRGNAVRQTTSQGRKLHRDELCSVCGRQNEKSKGVSKSKFCGYHYGG